MIFSLFSVWTGICFGFSICDVDPYREDGMCYALFGLQYDIEDKIIGIDFWWMYFEIKLKKQEPIKFDFDE